MFEKCEDIVIEDFISDEYIFYAHENETIKEHTNKCLDYFKFIVKEKKLSVAFEEFENVWLFGWGEEEIILFREMIISIISFHDIGKINPIFQMVKMENKGFKKCKYSNRLDSQHSIISSIIYLNHYLKKLKLSKLVKDKKEVLELILYVNAYVISKHHGSIGEFEKFVDGFFEDGNYRDYIDIIVGEYSIFLNKSIEINKENFDFEFSWISKKVLNSSEKNIYLYGYERLLYSLLVASDYYATTLQTQNLKIEQIGNISDINKIINCYEESKVMKSIRKYEKEEYGKDGRLEGVNDINVLRSEIFLDCEKELISHCDKNMFYLEAPTGSGKSNTALNLSFKLVESCKNINKIMYIYPFNTLVEQNIRVTKNIFDGSPEIMQEISVVNSVTPMGGLSDKNRKCVDDQAESYNKILLDRQFLNYPITLSTHVTLFDILFGNRRESAFSFHQLANSIIVLDEIQSYRNEIWTEIITFLKVFCKLLNIKIIIMSATLPDLDILSGKNDSAVRLVINREKYFRNPIFRDRVNVNYELFESKNILKDLTSYVKKFESQNKKILVEFITKNSAEKFYESLKNDFEIKSTIQIMTGDDTAAERMRILKEIDALDAETGFVLIATQVIEAGIDLNRMEYGFKDNSIFDSEEQFLGRINRSCKGIGIVYFFDLDNASRIYASDVRIDPSLTLKNIEMQNILKNKQFSNFYQRVLQQILHNNSSLDLQKNINEFWLKIVGRLNADKISEKMRLIEDDDWTCNVFLNIEVNSLDGEILIGSEIWKEYEELLSSSQMEYAEKKVKLSIVKSKMNNFIYRVKKGCTFSYSDQIGDIFYISECSRYFEDGRFCKKRFQEQIGDII